MSLPVVTDHYFVSAQFQRAGEDPVVNTFCFRNDSPSNDSGAVADNLRAILDTFYGTGAAAGGGVGDILAASLHSLVYVVYDLGDPSGGAHERASATFRTTPAAGGSHIPPDCAIVISWRTAKRGKSFRGRTYLGPLRATSMGEPGLVNATTRTQIANAAQLLIGVPLTRTASLHVLSRVNASTQIATGGYIDAEYDTQRRRGFRATQRTEFLAP